MTIITYFACDRCGTDSHDAKFKQITLSVGGESTGLHFCEPCLSFIEGEIKPLALALARKKKGK